MEPAIATPVKNTLQALGVQPVPRELAEDHKRKMLNAYAARGMREADMVATGRAYWCVSRPVRNPQFRVIEKLLLTRSVASMTPDRSAAPQPIIDVANVVHNRVKDATFSVEYLYDDPILNVAYHDASGQIHNDCLGIWDNGNVIAVAAVAIAAPQSRKLTGYLTVATVLSVVGVLICIIGL
jgi:hypothetical protein